MPRRKAEISDEVEGFQMTPMIDIVFQLIVFFLLVLDLSQQKIEALTLPMADTVKKDKSPDPNQVIVNIKANGDVVIDGKTLHDHEKDPLDNINLENFFKNRRAIQKYWFDPSGRVVNYPVLIRADRAADWIHVQKIMMVGSQLGGVYRVELGGLMKKE